MDKQIEIITQLCECCHEWVNQEDLVWDLEEDRLICIQCSLIKPKEWLRKQGVEIRRR